MKKVKLIIFTIIVMLLGFSIIGYAVDDSSKIVKTISEKTNIESSKKWIVTCNMKIDDKSIYDKVDVYDENLNKVDVSITINSDNKSFVVHPPKEGYEYGKRYCLKVTKNMEGVKGGLKKYLKEDRLMYFSIRNEVKNQRGNTNGNISNKGICAEQNGIVYYQNWDDGGKLYKMNLDGSCKIKIADDICSYINVIGNWIYYSNESDENRLYKIKTDGTNKIKMIDSKASYINVVGDWIYYYEEEKNAGWYFYEQKYKGYSLSKIKVDGTRKTKLNDGFFEYINVVGDWIYYSNLNGPISDENKDGIYKIKIDGSGKTKLTNDYRATRLNVVGDWIYYQTNHSSGDTMYKIKTDGSNKTCIIKDGYHLNVVGDWIYYSKGIEGYRLYKIKTDGTNERKVSNMKISKINIIGNNVYCRTRGVNWIYKIKKDGTGKTLISEKFSDNIKIVQNWIYYNCQEEDENGYSGYGIRKVKLDGTNDTLLTKGRKDEYIRIAEVEQNWIYYVCNNKIYKIKLDGKNKTQIADNIVNPELQLKDEWVYYTGRDGLYRAKSNGTNRNKIVHDSISSFKVFDNYITYSIYGDDKTNIYKIQLDGTNKKILFKGNKNLEYGARIYKVADDWIYFTSDHLYKIKSDGTNLTKLDSYDEVNTTNTQGDWIYYVNKDIEEGKMVNLKLSNDEDK